jgi:hypothetical protein
MPSSGYTAWSVAFGDQPTTAKWNQLGTNDASFNNGNGLEDRTILTRHIGVGPAVQCVNTLSSAVSTGTTLIPFDDTIPQNTEGDEVITVAITPKAATNKLHIRAVLYLANSVANNNIVAALFQDTTANALAAVDSNIGSLADSRIVLVLEHFMAAGTTSATTFKIRVGSSGASTTTFNGQSGARKFGGITKSNITITEYGA